MYNTLLCLDQLDTGAFSIKMLKPKRNVFIDKLVVLTLLIKSSDLLQDRAQTVFNAMKALWYD